MPANEKSAPVAQTRTVTASGSGAVAIGGDVSGSVITTNRVTLNRDQSAKLDRILMKAFASGAVWTRK
ncbi:hypothetical protein [Azospirillum sp.]|uniref:hypothetical protein n=1 Tax=Azospirillum sp. TaxID=34012 RepID=UPI00260C7685|nr:hypothetical protein [Azospirillum sp.]